MITMTMLMILPMKKKSDKTSSQPTYQTINQPVSQSTRKPAN